MRGGPGPFVAARTAFYYLWLSFFALALLPPQDDEKARQPRQERGGHVSWLQKLRGATDSSSEHARLDAMLMGVLSSVPQVSNVRWFRTQEDFRAERPGQP